MLLRMSFHNARGLGQRLLGDETREEEFWFGRGFAWTESRAGEAEVLLSIAVDMPKVVAQTKRRDREQRFGIGYCDSYAYTASGLMSVFLCRLGLRKAGDEVRQVR